MGAQRWGPRQSTPGSGLSITIPDWLEQGSGVKHSIPCGNPMEVRQRRMFLEPGHARAASVLLEWFLRTGLTIPS